MKEFFSLFKIKELNKFENSLKLFYESKVIKYDKTNDIFISDDKYIFDENIIKLSINEIKYEDFIKDKKEKLAKKNKNLEIDI